MLLDSDRLPPAIAERYRLWRPTLRYLMETEVHVYAFAMAANVLLSFFPFLIIMVSICRNLLQWKAAEQAIFLALDDYFPAEFQLMFKSYLGWQIPRGFQVTSIVLLLFTANGVFEPLEVALNRAWGIGRNRSFFRNQLVSLGLILACGSLVLTSFLITGLNQRIWSDLFPGSTTDVWFGLMIFKMAALPMTILALFLVYWLLPNGKVLKLSVAPVAVIVGVLLEVLKYLNLLTWPWLNRKLVREMGPFVHSTSIILWAFCASMIVLAGAHWAAQQARVAETEPVPKPAEDERVQE
jgi:uncharacterized BrkB/YihY/UPF0761 family membrane protein